METNSKNMDRANGQAVLGSSKIMVRIHIKTTTLTDEISNDKIEGVVVKLVLAADPCDYIKVMYPIVDIARIKIKGWLDKKDLGYEDFILEKAINKTYRTMTSKR